MSSDFLKRNILYKCIILVLLVYNVFQGISIYKLAHNSKIDDAIYIISQNYHDFESLEIALKQELANTYSDNNYITLQNYLLTLLSTELSNFEKDKYKKYNKFYTAEEFKAFNMYLENKQEEDKFESLKGDLFYLGFNSFVKDKTYRGFYPAIKELKKSKGIIIDLRDNSGGNVDEVIKILECFVPKGKILMKERRNDEIVEIVSRRKEEIHDLPIVILVNEKTASAAEMLAISLKENIGNTTIIGENTLGKGITTNTIAYKDGSAFMYISSYWDSPKGNNVSNTGIIPDVYVENKEKQFGEAMRILSSD